MPSNDFSHASPQQAASPEAASSQAGPPQAAFPPDPSCLNEVLENECTHLGLKKTNQAVGLALSGGGVRAATFALGVLQGLAQGKEKDDRCLLDAVDYLSSVSGGGYVACWFSRLVAKNGYEAARGSLRAPADSSVANLRNYGSYLTPQRGFFSSDTWRMVAGYLVRLVPNLLFILFAITGIILIPYLVRDLGTRISGNASWHIAAFFSIPPAAFLVCGVFASYGPGVKAGTRALGPVAMVLCFVTGIPLAVWIGQDAKHLAVVCLLQAALMQLLLAIFAWVRLKVGRYWPYLLIAILASMLVSWALLASSIFAIHWLWIHAATELSIALGPILFSLVYLGICATWTYCIPFDDEDQDFLNAHWGTTASLCLAWTLSALICCVAPHLFAGLISDERILRYKLSTSLIGVGTIAASLHSIFYDQEKPATAPPTSVSERARQKAQASANRLNSFFIPGAPYLILISILVLEAMTGAPLFRKLEITSRLLGRRLFEMAGAPEFRGLLRAMWHWERPSFELAGVIACGVMAFLVGKFMDINRFSMKNFYRSRLTTAYLEDDVPLLTKMKTQGGTDAGRPMRPYPVINCAMNVTSGKDLSVQSIRSRNFVFTPLFCGFDAHAKEAGGSEELKDNAYRRTEDYLSELPPRIRLENAKEQDKGIRLNDPMTISGAAANPSMGFHTSPALSFLLAMFNIRLGAWVGNPRHARTFANTPSTDAPALLLDDFWGHTGDASKYLMLSDGGHFENTAAYELVRRKCRLILCCDSGCDGRYLFGDLLHLVERCQVDFGVSITFPALKQLKPFGRLGYARTMYTIGRIDYGEAVTGYLVVFKPTVTYNSCETIRSFDRANASFPQVSTANQWFFESEFEAYRLLGMEAADAFVTRMDKVWTQPTDACFADGLYEAVKEASL